MAATVVVIACVAVTVKTLRLAVIPLPVRVPTKLANNTAQIKVYLLLLTVSDGKVVWNAEVFAGTLGEGRVDDCKSLTVVDLLKLQ